MCYLFTAEFYIINLTDLLQHQALGAGQSQNYLKFLPVLLNIIWYKVRTLSA